MCEIKPSGSNQANNKMFNIYDKSSGCYLGHATVTANLNGDDLLGENLKFVPLRTSALNEEYFEEEEVEPKFKNYLEQDLYLSDQDDQDALEDDDVTQEGGGVLSMRMSKFPKFQDAAVSHFQCKKIIGSQTGNQHQGESRPEKNNH